MKKLRMNSVIGLCLISLLFLLSLSLNAKPPAEAVKPVKATPAVKQAKITPAAKQGVVKPPVGQHQAKPVTNAPKTAVTTKAAIVQKLKTARIPTRELVKRLNTTNTLQIIETVEAIGNQDSGSKYVQEAFAKLLAHKDEDVQQAVLDEAYQFDSLRGMLPALSICLHDKSETIRDDAIDVLSEIETRAMIGILINNLTNKFEDVRDNAEFYLFYHTDEMYTNNVKWFSWWDTNKTSFVFE